LIINRYLLIPWAISVFEIYDFSKIIPYASGLKLFSN
jgi:hypothetical protein